MIATRGFRLKRSQRAALVVLAVIATVGGQTAARAWRPARHSTAAVVNVTVLRDPATWHGVRSGPAALPTLPGRGPVPTLPGLPPGLIPNPLPHATTTTAAPTTTTTTTAPVNPVVGFGAGDLQAAYGVGGVSGGSGGSGQTIAVIEASGDPSVESDLAVYRNHFGLPACSRANGCLRVVDQDGGTTQPPVSQSWALETATDLDMASAMCPACKLLVVQASAETLANFAAANNTAARLGATVIDNSWGWTEGDTGTLNDSAYTHTGVVTVAASGEGGYGAVEFPASSPNVVAVGGTSLVRDASGRGWNETAWSGTGSGCSTIYASPAWQPAACGSTRALTDVAAVADPSTGVAVYDSVGIGSRTGWMTVGGTSVAAAIVAGVFGLAGNAADLGPNAGGHLYANGPSLNDVTVGSSGACPESPTLCTAGQGWDGPTGNGTPRGASAF